MSDTRCRPRHRRNRLLALTAVLTVVLALALGLLGSSCGGDGASSPTTRATQSTGSPGSVPTTAPSTDPSNGERRAVAGEITVSAAASLKESFTRIAEDFEAAHPGTKVSINFGSSGELATQIRNGAPVDVAAFASQSDMANLAAGSLLAAPAQVFATNTLIIVTKPGNPRRISELTDLAKVAAAGVTVSLCADTAPCGRYADQILAAAHVSIPPDRVTRGQDVRATLTAVSQGDADAGIVYVTDAGAVGSAVDRVAIPSGRNAVASYPIAVTAVSRNPATARAFEDYVVGDAGRRTLRDAGFGPPP